MREIVFCLEEPSARRFLESLIARINPANVPIRYIVFDGKHDLESQLRIRLQGYRNHSATFIVMRDQDGSPDCIVIKKDLRQLCLRGKRPNAIVRIACRELEAFYWGDLPAVETALQVKGLIKLSNKKQFRNSDEIINPSGELRKATNGKYQKVAGSREIGKHISIENINSKSFKALFSSIQEVLAPGG